MWLLALSSLLVGSAMAAGAGPADRDRPQRAFGGALASAVGLLLLAATLEFWWHPSSHLNAQYGAGLGHWGAHVLFWVIAASPVVAAEVVLLVIANEREWAPRTRWLAAALLATLLAPVTLITWLFAIAVVWQDGL